jgi:CRP-like cAMP-binding protein
MQITSEKAARKTVTSSLLPMSAFDGYVDFTHTQAKSPKANEYLTKSGPGKSVLKMRKGQIIFTQGDPADSLFYVQRGWVKVSIASQSGKEATVALHREGDFLGIECFPEDEHRRQSTAAAFTACTLLRISRMELLRAIKEDKAFLNVLLAFLVNRCTLLQADLVDQIFNSSEKRLARTLLLLTTSTNGENATIPCITHQILAEIVGTTRSRVSFFMNRFR